MHCARLASDELSDAVRAQIRTLLWASFDRFTDDDWHHGLGGTHIVAFDGAEVIGHASVVPRAIYVGDRVMAGGYVEGVAVSVSRRRAGVGTAVMTDASQILADAYSLGVLSTSEHHFYEGLGWQRWRGPTYVIEGAQRRRTEAEDDGIMALVSNPVAGTIDLTVSIAVDARSGDDW